MLPADVAFLATAAQLCTCYLEVHLRDEEYFQHERDTLDCTLTLAN